jgi:hypothetical protein
MRKQKVIVRSRASGDRYPPLDPIEPDKPERSHYDLHNALERKRIYHDVVVLGDSEIDLEEYFADEERELPNPAKHIYQNLSLQDIVDLAPPGAKLSDIIFHMDYPRMIEYMEFTFDYIKRDEQEEERAFQVAMKEYEQDYAQYQKEFAKYEVALADYEQWEKGVQIKALEEQLNQLKK